MTAFYEKAKVFCITWQNLKEFHHFITRFMNKSHSPPVGMCMTPSAHLLQQLELQCTATIQTWHMHDNFQILEQKYAKTCKSLKKWLCYWCEVLLRENSMQNFFTKNRIEKSHLMLGQRPETYLCFYCRFSDWFTTLIKH